MSTNLPPRQIPPESDPADASSEADKDQYSLDEMMKALRDKEREKEEAGEVVTRSDGTVARKVKRRKRRSDQPEKEATPEKEKKRFMVKLVVAAVLVVALCLTGLFLIIHQNSKGFREGLEQQASEWTGGEVELAGLKRLPLSCLINEVKMDWGDDYFVKSLNVKKVEGDVGFFAFLGGKPSGLQLGGTSGRMTLQMPAGRWEGIQTQDSDAFPFGFDQYYCEALNVKFGENGPLEFKDVGMILSHEREQGYRVTLDDGLMKLAGWQDFPISNGLLRFNEGEIEVRSFSVDPPKKDGLTLGSSLKLSGMIPLDPEKQATLDITTGRFPLESLVGTRLSRFFEGSVTESKGQVAFTVGKDELDELQLDFKGDSVRLSGFPFLAALETLFPDLGFDQLEFQSGISQASLGGTLRMRPGGIAIENLDLEKKGKIQLEGGMIVGSTGKLGGQFDLMINRFFLTSHPKLKNSPLLAGSEDSGYVKVTFKLGGTLKKPEDNFLEVIGLNTTSVNPAGGVEEKKDLWDELLEPEKEVDLVPDLVPDRFKFLEELENE